MNLLVRTDASPRIGIGHLVRCLALARNARERGAHVVFVTRGGAAQCTRRIRDEGFAHHIVTSDENDEMADAAATVAVAVREGADVVVADSYALGAVWETAVRSRVGCMVAIDDLARRHQCDVLVDHNFIGTEVGRYGGRVPRNCVQLLGPAYALLAPEFAELRTSTGARARPPKRVLVAFGGSDPTNETVKALQALSQPEFGAMAVDVVIGDMHPARDAVLAAAGARRGVTLHVQLPSLAPLIAAADFALGAAGGTTWERLCLGLPSAVVAVAENQVAAARALSAAGYIEWLGMASATSPDVYAAALRRPHTPPLHLPQLVDGLGAERCVDAIFSITSRDRVRA